VTGAAHLMVLAGGFGTRLRSVVSNVPKPLAPVAGRPFLQYLIESWLEQGVTKLTFLLHYQAGMITGFLASQQGCELLRGCEVQILTEPRPLGTGGAVAYAVQQTGLTGPFLVANADTWLGSGLGEVLANAPPAIGVVRVNNSERYGSVRFGEHKVLAFEEKQNTKGAGWINAGLYHLRSDLFHEWNGQPFSLERDLFPDLAAAGRLGAAHLETEFIDIGIPEDYMRFCGWIESGKTRVL